MASRLFRVSFALIVAGLMTGLLLSTTGELCSPAHAAGPPEIGTPVPVAQTSGGSAAPDIAVASDGTRHVVWEETVDSTTYLYHSTSTNGITWTAPVSLSLAPGAKSPALAVAADGTPQLVFARYVSPTLRIYATRLQAGAWRAPQPLSNASYNAASPAIARAPDGTLYAAWVERPAGQYKIYVALSSDNGDTWLTKLPVVGVDDPAVLGAPAISVGSDGAVHLVWQKKDSVLASYDIFHKQRDPTTGWGDVATNISDSTVHSSNPAAVAEQRAYVLWEENDATRGRRGYTLTWTTSITLSTPGASASDPAVAMAGGVLHAAWDEGTELRTAFGWEGSPVVLAQDSAGVRDAALTGGPEGRLHAVWSQGSPSTANIYYTYRHLAHIFLPLTLRAFP